MVKSYQPSSKTCHLLLTAMLLTPLMLFSLSASAGLVFSPSVFYKNFTDEFSSSSKTEVTETFYDVKIGYSLSNGLYIGGIYAGMNREISNVEQSRSSYGASIGYLNNGWFLMGHYFLSSEYKIGSTTTYKGGNGFQVDLGHWFQLANQFYLGPQLTYRSWTYSDLQSGTSTISVSDAKGSEFLPFISLALLF